MRARSNTRIVSSANGRSSSSRRQRRRRTRSSAPREILGHSKAFLGVIEEAGASRTRVQVDCTELKRVDFVSAAALLNIAAELNRDGKRLELENVNELIAALFEVMGVAALAKVTTRH